MVLPTHDGADFGSWIGATTARSKIGPPQGQSLWVETRAITLQGPFKTRARDLIYFDVMPGSNRPPLSPRQAECLRRVRALQSTDEIARDLDISAGTVNGYVREAVAILGARDRRHAALLFAEMDRPDAMATAASPAPADAMVTVAAPVHPQELPPPPQRSVLEDSGVRTAQFETAHPIARVMREILNGSRPEGWSALTRASLILACVVVAGLALLTFSASLGAIAAIASALRDAAR